MAVHKPLRTLLALLTAICLLVCLTGCSKMENVTPAGASTTRAAEEEMSAADDAAETADDASPEDNDGDEADFDLGTDERTGVLSSGETIEYYTPSVIKNPGNHQVTLFIWNVDTYKQVTWKYRDTLTVQKLLEGLQHETNWDLSTAAVKLNDQKVTIWWSDRSSLYTGLPKQQNKEYLVFNRKDLDAAILDSVKTTLTENLGLSYTVCYAGPNGGDLTLPEVGVTIPADDPFSSFWDY
ncbi:MAG: hypothetical protein J5847_01465 [Clostridia bacterium]|nr:hypothetical protein [Clostridia bacterium]